MPQTAKSIDLLQERLIYKNKFVSFFDDLVRFSDDSEGSYIRLIFERNKSVGVLPILKDGRVKLIKSFRHGSRKWITEIPKGFMEPEESEEGAAIRETFEECGVTGGRLENIGEFRVNPALTDSTMKLYLLWDCQESNSEKPEGTESILQIPALELDEAIEALRDEDGPDLTTTYALTYLKAMT